MVKSSSLDASLFQVPQRIQSEKTRNFSKSQALYIGRKLQTTTRTSLRSSEFQSLYTEWLNLEIFLSPRAYMEGELGIFSKSHGTSLRRRELGFLSKSRGISFRGGGARNFSKSRSLYRGKKPGIFPSPRT